MSHELKTPLTSIQGFAQAILDGTADTPEARKQAAQVIYDESGRMHRMALDLLDLARLEAGTADLEMADVNVKVLLQGLVEKFTPQAKKVNVALQLSIPDGLPMLTADGDRLAQVFTNLVDNALKFTPANGEVVLSANKAEAEMELSVADSGVGVKSEALPHLFDRFYQADQHQKFFQAYDETVRVPLIIWGPKFFNGPRMIEALSSHIDLTPTLLGLTGIDPEPIRKQLAFDYSDARAFVGRDLRSLILGHVDPKSINEPVFFMTDDDVSRGLNTDNWMGITKDSVVQPNHVEMVAARLDDGKVWKYTRYFDNPQFWTNPGTPGDSKVKDVVQRQVDPNPKPDDPQPVTVRVEVTVKVAPQRRSRAEG